MHYTDDVLLSLQNRCSGSTIDHPWMLRSQTSFLKWQAVKWLRLAASWQYITAACTS